MDVQNALRRYENAQRAEAEAIQAMQALTRGDWKAINQARNTERETWHRLGAAHRELIDSILDDLHW